MKMQTEEKRQEGALMKHTKRITSHGSVSIPVAVRRELGIRERDAMDLEVDGQGRIQLQPHVPRCILCGGEGDTVQVAGKRICRGCSRKALALWEGGGD